MSLLQPEIWNIDFKCSDQRVHMLLDLLDHNEKRRLSRYRRDKDKISYIITHGTLRELLSTYEPHTPPHEWSFYTNNYGRPYLREFHPYHYNLTHTNSQAYCIISNDPLCGIDLETTSMISCDSNFKTLYLTQEEIDYISSFDEINQKKLMTKLWTLKEARLKASGVGLSVSMKNINFPCETIELEKDNVNIFQYDSWYYHLSSPYDGHYLAIVQSKPFLPIFL